MTTAKLRHIAISVPDLEASAAFYEQAFGLKRVNFVVTPYGDPFQVRLACIHSPQLHQGTAGLAAMAALESLLQPGAWVTLATRSKATDGMELAEIIAAGTTVSINLRQVQAGMALMERNTSSLCSQDSYREAELSARTRRLGLWGQPAGTNQMRP